MQEKVSSNPFPPSPDFQNPLAEVADKFVHTDKSSQLESS